MVSPIQTLEIIIQKVFSQCFSHWPITY